MPLPTPSDVHVDRPLTTLSSAFIQEASNFIATQVFPNVTVSKQSDLYFTYDKQDWFRSDVQLRAPGAETGGGGYRLSTSSYRADVFAIHRDIDDQTRANQDDPIQLESEATRWVTNQLLLHRENDFVNAFFQTSLWTGSDTGNDQTGVAAGPIADQFLQWNDANSTPIEDIRAQMVAMAEKTGFRPNTLVIGPRVWSALVDHPDILDRIKYTQTGVVSMDLVASLLGLDRVLVGWATRDQAAEQGTENMAFYWGSAALLCYRPASAGLYTPSAGYTFSWTGLLGSGTMGNRMKSFRLERNESDRIEGSMAYDLVQVSSDLGVFYASAVA